MRISDWSSDVCSSDLGRATCQHDRARRKRPATTMEPRHQHLDRADRVAEHCAGRCRCNDLAILFEDDPDGAQVDIQGAPRPSAHDEPRRGTVVGDDTDQIELELLETRSEEPTSELQSLMR